jgi:hypothetical protein
MDREFALYAMLNGVSQCARNNALEETTVRRFMNGLNWEAEDSFEWIRAVIRQCIRKLGASQTAAIFSIDTDALQVFIEHDRQLAPDQKAKAWKRELELKKT